MNWHTDEEANRLALLTTIAGMKPWFSERLNEAHAEAGRIDPEELMGFEAEMFYEENVGLYEFVYWPLMAASAVKESVGSFERYLESCAEDLLERFDIVIKKKSPEESWYWVTCEAFYKEVLDIPLNDSDLGIDSIRWIRNKVTHLGDTLFSEDGEKLYASHRTALDLDSETTTEESELGLFPVQYVSKMKGMPNLLLSTRDAWRIQERLSQIVCAISENKILSFDATHDAGTRDLIIQKLVQNEQTKKNFLQKNSQGQFVPLY